MDVDEIVAAGAAVLHIFAVVDAEWDETAQEEPGGGVADKSEISDPSADLKGQAPPHLIAHVRQTRKCGCYPNTANAPQINQVSRPALYSVLVVTG